MTLSSPVSPGAFAPLPDTRVIALAEPNVLVRGKYGDMVVNRHDRYVGQAMIAYGEYCESEVALFHHLVRSGMTVLDVGANLGAHTLAFARMVGPTGSVHAFEPQPVIFQNLCASIASNGLMNVRAWPYGAGSTQESAWVPALDYGQENNFGGLGLAMTHNHVRDVQVRIVRLDDLLATLPALHFIKIDVEGWELSVLEGSDTLLARHTPILYVENDRPANSPALIEWLWQAGYQLWWHHAALYNPGNHYGNRNNLYPGKFALNMLGIHRSRPTRIETLPPVTDSRRHPYVT
jgi:FkbM family methyltransferase